MPKVDDAYFAARRRQILDAAAACFAREGFHRTSMQDIVRESGISAGLIYRYFLGKDDMIAAIVTEWHERRTTMLGDADPAEGYLNVLRAVGDPAARPELQLAVQVWAETVRNPAIREASRANVDRPIEAVAPLLAGLTDDPTSLARVFIAIYQGLVLQTLWDDTVDHEAFIRAVATLLPAPANPRQGPDQ
ncbi:TetR/AcrR family transcriptional regulator [Dactylosporangium sp. NPDC051541]|uniref:TetR/AcrR family transcriptional regulator n=1 Tax=Dactylosporangium sp. NPDC051541 TaxID=3363977 RepID=UPI00379E8316